MPLKLAQDIWYELWEETGSRRRSNGKEQEDTVTHIETNQTKRKSERAPRRLSDPTYWLIAKNQNGRIEVLTLERDGEQMLPVFGHEEEAEMFLRLLRGVGEEWGVSESGAEELISVLYGPCAGVKEVALDPLPEMVAQRTVGLVSLLRERFIEYITARRRRPLRLCDSGQGSLPREGERRRRNDLFGGIDGVSVDAFPDKAEDPDTGASQSKKTSAFEERQNKHEGRDVERAMFLASLRA